MSNIFGMTEAASIALHAAVYLAEKQGHVVSTHDVANALQVSENHLAKVHQRLARHNLVQAVPGPRGGFRLARSPRDITLMEVYEAIEGPFKAKGCLFDRRTCTRDMCIMGNLVERLNSQFMTYLASTNLQQLLDKRFSR